jgi:TrkA-C domain
MGYGFIAVYISIILLVVELCTALFVLTGLDKHIARFQVISILTGTGFTTGESELIIAHPIRRRLGAFLIFFGAFSLAVIISAISGILQESFHFKEIGIVAGILAAVLLIVKLPSVQKKLSDKIHKELEEDFSLEELPIKDVFLHEEDDFFADIHIHEESRFIGKTLKEQIKEEDDINVFFIRRGDVILRHKRYEEKIQAGDQLLLYGDKNFLEDFFADEIEAQKKMEKEKIETHTNSQR